MEFEEATGARREGEVRGGAKADNPEYCIVSCEEPCRSFLGSGIFCILEDVADKFVGGHAIGFDAVAHTGVSERECRVVFKDAYVEVDCRGIASGVELDDVVGGDMYVDGREDVVGEGDFEGAFEAEE